MAAATIRLSMYPTSVLLRKEHRIRVALAGADASLFERYRQVRQRELALTPDGIALLVFGPKKLPELGKGIGKGIRGFKSAMKEEDKPATTEAIIVNDQVKGLIMGFGAEVLFMIILGLVVLGSKRLHTVLQHVAQMRADFEKASRGVKSQFAAELEGVPQNLKTEFPNKRMTSLH